MNKPIFATQTMSPLSEAEKHVLLGKGTEAPFSGAFCDYEQAGRYFCRRCGQWLYDSEDKFDAGCGWPSFDSEVPGAVARISHPNDARTEIVCANCGSHLGHVFEGEKMTPRNVRHCVNSVSLHFEAAEPEKSEAVEKSGQSTPNTDEKKVPEPKYEVAVFAGGCFWGVEHSFRKVEGVNAVVSGYTGGSMSLPCYKDVCTGSTGHAEAVEVTFDPTKVSFERLARLFFEIHDPTQRNRQGPDVGTQYRSAVFYANFVQKHVVEGLIDELRALGFDVVTEIAPQGEFFPAEEYHQRFAENHPHMRCSHGRTLRFSGERS